MVSIHRPCIYASQIGSVVIVGVVIVVVIVVIVVVYPMQSKRLLNAASVLRLTAFLCGIKTSSVGSIQFLKAGLVLACQPIRGALERLFLQGLKVVFYQKTGVTAIGKVLCQSTLTDITHRVRGLNHLLIGTHPVHVPVLVPAIQPVNSLGVSQLTALIPFIEVEDTNFTHRAIVLWGKQDAAFHDHTIFFFIIARNDDVKNAVCVVVKLTRCSPALAGRVGRIATDLLIDVMRSVQRFDVLPATIPVDLLGMPIAGKLKDLADVVALTLEDYKRAAELGDWVELRPRDGHQLGAVIKHRDKEDDNGSKIDKTRHKNTSF